MKSSQDKSRLDETDGVRVSEIVEELRKFDGSTEQFFQNLLAVQCLWGRADGAAILFIGREEDIRVLAVYSQSGGDRSTPTWLAKSAEFAKEAISTGTTAFKTIEQSDVDQGQAAKYVALFVPVKIAEVGQAVEVFLLKGGEGNSFEECWRRLELPIELIGLFEGRLAGREKQTNAGRLRKAMETLSAVNMQDRFKGSIMAFCNEMAAQWQCERTSIGFLKGRYVVVRAMSHTEDFSRKMKIVQDIESAMEECLDQDCEILHPSSPEATYISRSAAKLATGHGPLAVLSVPLQRDGQMQGVLTLERLASNPFNLEETEAIRLTCDLCTARLANLHQNDRWFGAKLAGGLRKAAGFLVGSKHTGAKIAAILCFGAILFLVFAKGQFRVEAPFALEATHLQVVPAPFDGYLKSVKVEVGDSAWANKTILAELDTVELRLQRSAAKADEAGYLKQVSAAMRDGETAGAQLAQANADKVAAQIDLLNHMIDQASLVSPINGVVVKGDLKRQIGAPVKTGDVLFEVALTESLRAELLVPESEIHDIEVGQEGYLATASYPGKRVKFHVDRINPAAEVVAQRNVFRVRVRLEQTHPWMRPGMEGIAKVSIDRRRYAWIWSRKVVNWIRMKLWI